MGEGGRLGGGDGCGLGTTGTGDLGLGGGEVTGVIGLISGSAAGGATGGLITLKPTTMNTQEINKTITHEISWFN